jgi:hypothetical protein
VRTPTEAHARTHTHAHTHTHTPFAMLSRYREKRIAEMKAEAGRPQYGEVIDITASEYVKEVNEAGEGVWVVVLLYSTSISVSCTCMLVTEC